MEGMPRPFVPNRPHWNHQSPPPLNQWRNRPPPHLMGPRPFRPNMYPNFNSPRPMRPVISPQNQEYWCETCDRAFLSKKLLDKHLMEHQKCNIDGCQFVAHPKIITKHIQMQHSTGIYKKIAVLNNPEEIEKWREERRKKYPTKANIEKKQAAVNEKIERGEKMGLENRRNHNNRTFTPGQKRRENTTNENHPRSKYTKFNNNTESKNELKNKKAQVKKGHPKIIPQMETRKLKPFAGIQSIVEDDDVSEEVNEVNDLIEYDDEIQGSIANDDKNPSVCTALSSLLCNYGSSDEDIDESDKKPVNNTVPKVKSNKASSNHNNVIEIVNNDLSVPVKEVKNESVIVTQNCEDEDSGPEEVKVEKTKEITPNNEEEKLPIKDKTNVKKSTEKPRINHLKRPKPKIPSTLLQKLLSREMQQERNIVLQCIRYIRKNNYFDKKNCT